jgi:gluconokinase
VIILLMGVSGSGKTTAGRLLAAQLGWEFADADDYHSAGNIEKMRDGIPLSDAERAPWLEALRGLLAGWLAEEKSGVLACSALKQTYRDRLRLSSQVQIVYLKGMPELFHQRLRERVGHFMKEAMLQSQLATLEEPDEEEALVVNAAQSPEAIAGEIHSRLALPKLPSR